MRKPRCRETGGFVTGLRNSKVSCLFSSCLKSWDPGLLFLAMPWTTFCGLPLWPLASCRVCRSDSDGLEEREVFSIVCSVFQGVSFDVCQNTCQCQAQGWCRHTKGASTHSLNSVVCDKDHAQFRYGPITSSRWIILTDPLRLRCPTWAFLPSVPRRTWPIITVSLHHRKSEPHPSLIAPYLVRANRNSVCSPLALAHQSSLMLFCHLCRELWHI